MQIIEIKRVEKEASTFRFKVKFYMAPIHATIHHYHHVGLCSNPR